MAKYLLDSDVLIDYLNGQTSAVTFIQKLVNEQNLLHITSINITEIFAGTPTKERDPTEQFLNSFFFAPVDQKTSRLAGEYLKKFKEKGKILSLSDATLASVAKTQNLILATRNIKDYPMGDIAFVSP